MQTHVSSWEELPEGEWLDNDEEGTHWYLANDGTHWHSTEDGFTVWKEDETDSHESKVDAKAYDEEDEDDDDDEFSPKVPTPNISVFTAIIGILIALAVIGWTYSIAIPMTDENVGMLERNEFWSTESSVPEDQIWLDGLKTVQTLNTITIVLAGIMVAIGTLSLLKKSPWWGLSAAHLSLTSILMFTVFTAFSAEKEWVEACNPLVVYCFQIPTPSLSVIDAFYPAILSAICLLIVVNNSFKSWAEFDPEDEEDWEEFTDEDDFDYEEVDAELRGKIKTIVLSIMLLLAGLGIFATYQYASEDLYEGPEFQIRDAVGNITNESDDVLVVIDLIDRSTMYRILFFNIEIQINEGEWVQCGYEQSDYAISADSRCIFDFLESIDDNKLTAEESIMISEYRHLCNGEPDEVCEVTVKLTYAYDEQEDYSGPEVLAVLTVNAVSE
ncbi:hypothetical protein OAM96_03555 [Candidatus Poseidoniaceae archaeon]|nr:hypothetical protein [Candidatus Poseidoniaceae archaeon]